MAALALVLVLGMSITAFAQTIDMDTTGSISLDLAYDDQAVTGGTFALYMVGSVTLEDGNYTFVLTEDFEASGADLTDLESETLAAELLEYALSAGIEPVMEVENESGTVLFSDLSVGLYLVAQTADMDGYESISPFLVSLPQSDEEGYVYNVSATAKLAGLTAVEEETEAVTTVAATEYVTETELPYTGQLTWPVPVLCVAGLVLFLIGFDMRYGRRKESYAA